jgi:LuxR family maltose regulon positive regulatory protein
VPETLLQTKLYIPPLRSNLVNRPRLIDRLNQGLEPGYKLSIISAPAGFGKTTMLSEWVHGSNSAVAWVSLDKGDNDLTRFLAYFITALQTLEPAIGDGALGLLQSPQQPETAMILTALINDVAKVLLSDPQGRNFAIVLDDYHLINAQPVHEALTFLLDNLPPQMHLGIASRTDPPLPLSRLRIRGELVELREADLRFTIDETASLFSRAMGINLSADDIAALDTRTEGWIAGLQVAALSMKGVEDTSGFIKEFTGSHRYIMDYLVDEVLNQQPENIQNFLQQTAILDRITGPLCDALTQKDGCREILEALDRDNLFIIPLDDERCWYRYHHLFADLLRTRLEQESPESITRLHQRASEWYESNNFLDAAANHALAAQDYDRAAELIEKLGEDLWERGEPTSLLGWLNFLPNDQVIASPSLCNFHAWTLYMNGQNEAAEARLQAADQALELSEREDVEQQGRVAAIRAAIASRQGDVPGIYEFSHQALQYLPEESLLWRTITMMALGFAQDLGGDTVAASEAFAEAVRLSEASDNIYLILSTNLHLGNILNIQGRLREMYALCQELLLVAQSRGVLHTEMAGCLYDELGLIMCEWNQLDTAMHHLKKGSELSKHGFDIGVLGYSYLTTLRALFTQRDWSGAREKIRELENMERDSDLPPWYINPKEAWKARIWMAQGNVAAALRWVEARGLNPNDDVKYLREEEYIVLVRILAATDEIAESLNLSNKLIASAELGSRNSITIRVLLIQAIIYRTQGNMNRAFLVLDRALHLAEQGGYIRVFVDEGEPMADMLREFSRQSSDIGREYLDSLLAAFDDGQLPEHQIKYVERIVQQDELVEPLSDRELDVLRLLSAGLSYREIAEELYISINTVKAHAKNIYSKLGVHGRMQAAQRATELNLL